MKNSTPTSLNGWKLNNPTQWVTHSPQQTLVLGQQIGALLKPGSVLCFCGDLGAGKTTLIKGIIQGVTGISPDQVSSPTFVYLNPYKGLSGPVVYHFDLYRLQNPEEFLWMGFDEYLSADGICCIEWSERIFSLLPSNVTVLRLTHKEAESRCIEYEPNLATIGL